MGVELVVELLDGLGVGNDLAPPLHRVEAEDRPRDAGQVLGPDGVHALPARHEVAVLLEGELHELVALPLAAVDNHHVSRHDVVSCLEVGPVTEGDAGAGVGTQQAVLAEREHVRATARQRALRGRTTTDIRAVADDHALGDATLDDGLEDLVIVVVHRAGVEVDEALLHDRGAGLQVSAEAHPGSVTDAHALGRDVVEQVWELVSQLDRRHGQTSPEEVQAHLVHAVGIEDADVGPAVGVQEAEDALEVDGVRLDLEHRQQVQPQVGVAGVDRCLVEVIDADHDGHLAVSGDHVLALDLLEVVDVLDGLDVGVLLAITLEALEVVQQAAVAELAQEHPGAVQRAVELVVQRGGHARSRVGAEVDAPVELDVDDGLQVLDGGDAEREGVGHEHALAELGVPECLEAEHGREVEVVLQLLVLATTLALLGRLHDGVLLGLGSHGWIPLGVLVVAWVGC